MERFMEGKVAIKCETKQELYDFLQKCEAKGLRWFSGKKATDFTPYTMPISIVYDGGDSLVYICLEDNFDYDIVTYKEYFKPKLKDEKDPCTFFGAVYRDLNLLKTILKKKVNIFDVWRLDTYEEYKKQYRFAAYHAEKDILTKNEFKLLKEALENEQIYF